jgi:hypothetical protein
MGTTGLVVAATRGGIAVTLPRMPGHSGPLAE